jgi:RHS repeat-associated protein
MASRLNRTVAVRGYDTDGNGTLDARHFYCHNDLFSVQALVTGGGTVVERYEYDPYGKVTVLDAGGTPKANPDFSEYGSPWTFTGRRLDPETGLLYFRNRYYHPGLGRFVGRDPIGYEGGSTLLYEYVSGQPSGSTDPMGLVVGGESPLCLYKGKPVTCLFDGDLLSCTSGDSWPAVSGRPEKSTQEESGWERGFHWTKCVHTYVFDYRAARQKIANVGPIPAGRYFLDPWEERSSRTSWQHFFGGAAWGSYSWSLHIHKGTETYGRGGFFIHGGREWGSAGCIDLLNNDVALHKVMETVRKENTHECCRVDIEVKYAHEKVTRKIEIPITWASPTGGL